MHHPVPQNTNLSIVACYCFSFVKTLYLKECCFACLYQLEEDHRYNVWRQTSHCVWLRRGDSFSDFENILTLDRMTQFSTDITDLFSCVKYVCKTNVVFHCLLVCRWGKAAALLLRPSEPLCASQRSTLSVPCRHGK